MQQGVPVADLCRKVGITEQSFYRWKKVYGGWQPGEARELKQLREGRTPVEAAGRRPGLRQGHAAGPRSKKF
ncbi:transposase [Luteitalea sp.]